MNTKAILSIAAAAFAINASAGELYPAGQPFVSSAPAQSVQTPLAQFGELSPAGMIATGKARADRVVTSLQLAGERGFGDTRVVAQANDVAE